MLERRKQRSKDKEPERKESSVPWSDARSGYLRDYIPTVHLHQARPLKHKLKILFLDTAVWMVGDLSTFLRYSTSNATTMGIAPYGDNGSRQSDQLIEYSNWSHI